MGRAAAWAAGCALIGLSCGVADGGGASGGGASSPVGGAARSGPGAADPRGAQEAAPQIRIVYLVPGDRAFNPLYERNVERAIAHLQGWYRTALSGSRTFLSGNPVIEHRSALHSADWYSNHAIDVPAEYRWWYNAAHEGFALTGGQFGDP